MLGGEGMKRVEGEGKRRMETNIPHAFKSKVPPLRTVLMATFQLNWFSQLPVTFLHLSVRNCTSCPANQNFSYRL